MICKFATLRLLFAGGTDGFGGPRGMDAAVQAAVRAKALIHMPARASVSGFFVDDVVVAVVVAGQRDAGPHRASGQFFGTGGTPGARPKSPRPETPDRSRDQECVGRAMLSRGARMIEHRGPPPVGGDGRTRPS